MSDIPVTVEPPFVRHQAIQSSNVTALDICYACTRNGGTGQLEGVQRVNNLWRIYLKSRSTRLELFLRKTIDYRDVTRIINPALIGRFFADFCRMPIFRHRQIAGRFP